MTETRTARPSREHQEKSRHKHDEKRDKHRSHQRHRDDTNRTPAAAAELPFNARHLRKGDFSAFLPLFAHFLSVQKAIELEDLDEREARGRWKSFVGKWNRGEHAEGWYDPDLFSRVLDMNPMPALKKDRGHESPRAECGAEESADDEPTRRIGLESDDDEEDYGPTLPNSGAVGERRMGPGVPSFQDLSLRDEMIEEEKREARKDSIAALRTARKADRAEQKDRLEELVPRADPGSRERKLEKRQAVNAKMREFRDKSPGIEGADESEVMGGGDSLEEHRKMKETEQKKKTERQMRREEFERAKKEEIDAKRKAWQEREEGTMSMLRDLAKQRFG